jgi:hypothetical protein
LFGTQTGKLVIRTRPATLPCILVVAITIIASPIATPIKIASIKPKHKFGIGETHDII